MNSKSFLYSGEVEKRDPSEEVNELFVISSDMSLTKLKQTKDGSYQTLLSRSLQNIDGLKKALDQLKAFETMSVSDRTIVFREKVFSVGSGRVFDALSQKEHEDKSIISFPV